MRWEHELNDLEFNTKYDDIDFFGIFKTIKNRKWLLHASSTLLKFEGHIKNNNGEYEMYYTDKVIDKFKSTQTKKIKQFLYTKYQGTKNITNIDGDDYIDYGYSHHLVALLDNKKYLEIYLLYIEDMNTVHIQTQIYDNLTDVQNKAKERYEYNY